MDLFINILLIQENVEATRFGLVVRGLGSMLEVMGLILSSFVNKKFKKMLYIDYWELGYICMAHKIVAMIL
jgi:hypothetical protein